jgi:putative ABC transport system substrate-binding protein
LGGVERDNAAGGHHQYGCLGYSGPIRRSAGYVDRLLNGAKASDLPVQQPTKFTLVINLKTAQALGVTVSLPMLGSADEVIE